jgi:hypothetical protein
MGLKYVVKWRAVALGIGVLVCWTAPLAEAQGTPGMPPRPEQTANASSNYDRLIEQALAAFAAHDHTQARQMFEQAHALRPSARTLRGLGITAVELKQYTQAKAELEAALADGRQPLTDVQRAEVSALLDWMRSSLGLLLVVIAEPASAQLQIDNKPAQLGSDGIALLEPGPHEILAQAEGFEPQTRSVNVENGKELRVLLHLQPLGSRVEVAAAQALKPIGPPSEVVAAAQVSPKPAHPTLVQWLLLGGSGAVAITGGVLLGLALSDKSTVEHANGKTLAEIESAHDRVPVLSSVGAVMLGVGLAGAGATLGWLLLGDRDESRPSTTLWLGPASVQVRGVL